MKMPENISPEIAAYIRALQTENSNLQNKNSELNQSRKAGIADKQSDRNACQQPKEDIRKIKREE